MLNCYVQTDLHVHQTCVVDSATHVETAFRSFQMTALTWQHKPHLLNKKQFISWTRNMVAELRCKQVVSSGCWLECWHGLLASQPFLFVLRSSPGSRSAGAATSAMEDMETTRSTEIANRIGQLEANIVCERVARFDAGQHVTVQRQRLSRNPKAQVQTQSPELIAAKVWEKPGKPDVPSYGACNDWELVMLPYTRS